MAVSGFSKVKGLAKASTESEHGTQWDLNEMAVNATLLFVLYLMA